MLKSKTHLFPNVRDVQQPNEIKALNNRYHTVKELAKRDNTDKFLSDFENFLQNTFVVVNAPLTVLENLLESEMAVYFNYYQRLTIEPKKFDKDREFVDMILFGKYRCKIRYAALCLNGTGLTAYGECCMYLKIEDFKKRTSLLEENSFIFIGKYPPKPLENPKFPYGYRADWENRHKLAVAKLGHKIKQGMQVDDFANILLKNTGDKVKDDFIEVHIFGAFNYQNIDFVVKSPKVVQTEHEQTVEKKRGAIIEKRRINFVREKLEKLGKKWIET